ncbi:hypothetical protein G7Y79_00038g074610 [Physcia stellaris]|nr:hypothetical protein G7Y79_00038g074610 [Physcia stellaris]
MQQVEWSSKLSFIAQHDDFAPLCARLVESGNRFGIFYTNDNEIKTLQQPSHSHLLQRARLRHSAFRSSQFGGGADFYAFDKTYQGRDCSCITDRGLRTYQISALIAEWPSRFEASPDIAANFRRWGTMSGFGKVFDTSKPIVDLLQVAYSSSWGPLRGLCCRLNQNHDKYRLLFTFGIIAYGKKIGALEDLQTLLAFAFSEDLRQIQLHLHDSISRNYNANEDALIEIIGDEKMCPDDMSTGNFHYLRALLVLEAQSLFARFLRDFITLMVANIEECRRQEQTDYQIRVQAQANTVARGYIAQWPCARPLAFAESTAPPLQTRPVYSSLASRFAACIRSKEMEAYLLKLQAKLDDAKQILTPVSPEGWQALVDATRPYEPFILPNLTSLLSIKASKFETFPDQLYTVPIVKSPVEDTKFRHVLSTITPKKGLSRHDGMRQRYKADLEGSLDAFLKREESVEPRELPYELAAVKLYFDASKKYVDNLYEQILMAIEAAVPSSNMLDLSGLWPRTTLTELNSFEQRH